MSTPSDRTGSATHADASGERFERKSERPTARPSAPQSLVGHVLSGRYRIERLVGEGGMGAVYQAEHTHIRKRVAVKVLHAEMIRLPEVVARFEREALAAAHIEHPNVAAASDFGKLEDGSFFLVLEYVEGKSLRDAIAGGRLDLSRALHVAWQIASALSRAHALGIVHRDLKPENVMLVTRERDENFVKVLDFGIAKVPVGELVGETKSSGQALTQMGMVYGTPEYMAPEQALGHVVDARADLYALGAMTFEMITGARPFDHESKVTLLGMQVTAPIPRMADRAPDARIPMEVEELVMRLLAKEAAARFPDAKALMEALHDAMIHIAAVDTGRPWETPAPRSLGQSRHASTPDLASPIASLRSSAPLARAKSDGSRSPRRVTWRRVALAGSAVGLFALLGVVVGAAHVRGASAPGLTAPGLTGSPLASGGVTTAPPAPRAPDRTADTIVNDAQSKIEKGDFATAIDELTGVERMEPARPGMHMLLEHAYTGARNTREAMREAELWLRSDPNAAADVKLEEDIRNAALIKDAQDEAFALLESKMGTRGVDILDDIAFGVSGRQYPQAALRARHSLEGTAVRARASRSLSLLLEFRDAKTCEQKHALLERARDYGDARLAVLLHPYEGTRGCGFLGRSDCHPCMRRDRLLSEAIGAIEDRAAKAR